MEVKTERTLTANWKLYNAQLKIHEMAKKYQIRPKFFHGRGGSLDEAVVD